MSTLEARLTELSEDLLARTSAIDAADCIASDRVGLVDAPVGRRRRVVVGALAFAVAVATTGGVYAFTRRDATGVHIVTTVPPSTAPTPTTKAPTASEFVAALPDCVPVDDTRGDTVGCVLKRELDGARVPHAGEPGLRVYGDGGAVVGYEIPSVGYVTRAVGDDSVAVGRLTKCVTLLDTGALDGSPELAGCTPVLIAFGIPDPAKTAHEIPESLAQQQEQFCRSRPTLPMCTATP